MARDYSYRFSVEMTLAKGYVTPAGWDTRERAGRFLPKYLRGTPNDAKLARYVADYNDSLKPGGVNAHLGFSATAVAARILDHHNDRKVVASWRA